MIYQPGFSKITQMIECIQRDLLQEISSCDYGGWNVQDLQSASQRTRRASGVIPDESESEPEGGRRPVSQPQAGQTEKANSPFLAQPFALFRLSPD